jgi:hypothetical protein
LSTDEPFASLVQRMRSMRPADLSVLAGMLQTPEPEVNIATTIGSDNDLLWSEMARIGWMTLGSADDLPAGSRVFKVGAAGRERIAKLLDEVRHLEERTREAMPVLFNELCRQIPPQIAERVIAAGGNPSDLAMMLAGIVEATMRRWVQPELHDEFLRAVAGRAQDLRERFKRPA